MKNLKQTIFSLVFLFVISNIFSQIYDSSFHNKLIEKKYLRVVSLSPAITEIIFSLNANHLLFARTDFCDFPEETKNIPSCGGFDGKTLSLEKIISFSPDLVFVVRGMHDHLIKPLQKMKIAVYVSEVNTIENLFYEILSVGKLLGNDETAVNYCNDLKSRIRIVKDKISKITLNEKNINKPKIFWQVDYSPYITVGKNSFINEMIECVDAKNIFSDIKNAYPIVSEESIVVRNPDAIIIPNYEELKIVFPKSWNNINAVKNNKIIFIDASISTRSSGRFVECIEIMANQLYGIENK
ncbi:MAG: ABC transporter substrate-binding protein [Treponema sp.]|nr:ABC transporter substrate-binding protein [Treponema sp.]